MGPTRVAIHNLLKQEKTGYEITFNGTEILGLIESAGCYEFVNKNVSIFCLAFWIQFKRIWSYYMSVINNVTKMSFNLSQIGISYLPSRLAVLLGCLSKHVIYTKRSQKATVVKLTGEKQWCKTISVGSRLLPLIKKSICSLKNLRE